MKSSLFPSFSSGLKNFLLSKLAGEMFKETTRTHAMQPVARRFNIVNHSGLNMVMVTFSVSLFALGTRKAATQKRIF